LRTGFKQKVPGPYQKRKKQMCWAAAREHEKARRAHAFAVRTFPVMIIPNLSKLLDFGCLAVFKENHSPHDL